MVDVQLRWATSHDARAVAAVHVDSWRQGYAGLIDQRVLDGLSVDERAEGWVRWIENPEQPHRLVVAEIAGHIVGWATFGPARDEGMSEHGELAGLYVHPDFWSQRIGHGLLRRVEAELHAAGFEHAYLWVLRGNDRAASFYSRHGWDADGAEKVADAGGATALHEFRHSRRLDEPTL
jgi:GNAT superfamily N-acetyltransferase